MSTIAPKSDWQGKILLELAFFIRLPEKPETEWRVRRPTMAAYVAAVDLITAIDTPDLPIPRIAPNREGGIEFEWDGLEIGVSPTGAYEFLSTKKTKTGTETEEGHAGYSQARQLIASLAY